MREGLKENYRTRSCINVMNTKGIFKMTLFHSTLKRLPDTSRITLYNFPVISLSHQTTQFQLCHPNTSTPNLAITVNTMNDTLKNLIKFYPQ